MDPSTIEPQRLKAGREYDESLARLGLRADAVLWAYDTVIAQFVLVVVTEFFDFKGPLEISEKLFQAYNASITPQEIDPFTIRLHSTDQHVGQWCHRFANGINASKADPITKVPVTEPNPINAIEIHGLKLNKDWVIVARPQANRKNVELSRRWQRFASNVAKLAA